MLLTKCTLSEAVASLVPWELSARHESAVWWAGTSTGAFSVLARSISWTWPVFLPGSASREFVLLGHKVHKPLGLEQVSNMWSCCGTCVNVYT